MIILPFYQPHAPTKTTIFRSEISWIKDKWTYILIMQYQRLHDNINTIQKYTYWIVIARYVHHKTTSIALICLIAYIWLTTSMVSSILRLKRSLKITYQAKISTIMSQHNCEIGMILEIWKKKMCRFTIASSIYRELWVSDESTEFPI